MSYDKQENTFPRILSLPTTKTKSYTYHILHAKTQFRILHNIV
jgi:hypothetical protein